MEKKLKLSVHNLVDFLLRKGSIDTRVFNKSSMTEGSRIHAYYQKKQGDSYLSEYYLEHTFLIDDFSITLQGRADGIILFKNEVIIDEIKSTVIDLDVFANEQGEWHIGQAKCYALMYGLENDLKTVTIRMTYIHQGTDKKMIRQSTHSIVDLQQEIEDLMHRYIDFYNIVFRRTERRNQSSIALKFPFNSFRLGQKELAKYVYAIAKQGGTLFVEAPTGIGKTISTLYPFVKSFGDETTDKIFYLTAKNSGKEAAFQTMGILKKKGLEASVITITAKDKICFNPGAGCNPDECPFAKDYYNKVNDVLKHAILTSSTFDYETITKFAFDANICPFEFELDLSLFTDVIICDYNYLFDPLVYMRRYFEESQGNYLALIDETHNLVERARDMYSAEITTKTFTLMKKALKKLEHKKIKASIRALQKHFNTMLDMPMDTQTILAEHDMKFDRALNTFLLAGQDVLKNFHSFVNDDFLDFYFGVNKYLKLLDMYDDSFTTYLYRYGKKDLSIKIFNLDPSRHIRRNLEKVNGRVLFSATLSPVNYYVDVLGGTSTDPVLMLPNPFPPENRLLMIAPTVSTKYKHRQDTFGEVARYIERFISHRIGNYLVFFPSYQYLMDVASHLQLKDHVDVMTQTKEMKDDEKDAFLDRFVLNPTRTTIGLAVLGGAFSEGIDLVEDRLIGAVIIGVGLPQISYERDLIKQYYDHRDRQGFEFSYVNPGMNRVMQAVGRVIRSETDRGAVLLIDDRYLQTRYRSLFKQEWANYQVVTTPEDVDELTSQFWSEK